MPRALASLDCGSVVLMGDVLFDLPEDIVLSAFEEATHVGMRFKVVKLLVGHSNISVCKYLVLTRCAANYAICMEEPSRAVLLIDRVICSSVEK